MKLINEFKEFAMRGNVIDLAVGVVIGASFSAIVKTFVDNIITPPIGWLVGGVDFSGLSLPLPVPKIENGQPALDAVEIKYGLFLQALFAFTITALALFIFIKAINRFLRTDNTKKGSPVQPPEEILLLREIRDSLKTKTPSTPPTL